MLRFTLTIILISTSAAAQSALQKQIRTIAADARGKVAVACSLPDSTLNCDLEPHAIAVYKLLTCLPAGLCSSGNLIASGIRGLLSEGLSWFESPAIPHGN